MLRGCCWIWGSPERLLLLQCGCSTFTPGNSLAARPPRAPAFSPSLASSCELGCRCPEHWALLCLLQVIPCSWLWLLTSKRESPAGKSQESRSLPTPVIYGNEKGMLLTKQG